MMTIPAYILIMDTDVISVTGDVQYHRKLFTQVTDRMVKQIVWPTGELT